MTDSIKKILKDAKNIAIYGASANKEKDSYKVMQYLQSQGYETIPINCFTDQECILGEKVFKKLEDVNINLDILNIFRPSFEILEISKKIIDKKITKKKIQTMWLQLDIYCLKSEKIMRQDNSNFIQNKCTKKEHSKLFNINLN